MPHGTRGHAAPRDEGLNATEKTVGGVAILQGEMDVLSQRREEFVLIAS